MVPIPDRWPGRVGPGGELRTRGLTPLPGTYDPAKALYAATRADDPQARPHRTTRGQTRPLGGAASKIRRLFILYTRLNLAESATSSVSSYEAYVDHVTEVDFCVQYDLFPCVLIYQLLLFLSQVDNRMIMFTRRSHGSHSSY